MALRVNSLAGFGGKSMRVPSLRATARQAGSGSSPSITLPVGYTAGDLLVLAITFDGETSASTPAGWTQQSDTGSGNGPADRNLQVFRKVATGSEGASVTVTLNRSTTYAAHVYAVKDANSAQDNSASGGSGAINIGSLAPTWSLRTVMWIAFGTYRTSSTLTAPAGYTDIGSSNTSNTTITSGWFVSRAASEDPGPFVDNDNDNWAGTLVACAYV